MKALTIIAHGSRNTQANAEFLTQADAISSHLHNDYALKEHCFLELAEPSLQQACETLVKQGATEIDVYPLFFNRGKHVSVDVPGLVDAARQALPAVTIRLLAYFGSGDDFAKAVAGHIDNQA